MKDTKVKKGYSRLYKDETLETYTDCIIIDVPLYPVTIAAGIMWEEDGTSALCRPFLNENLIYVVVNKKSIKSINTISHEVFHIKEYIEDLIGDKLKGESGSYLLGWLCEVIQNNLIKLSKNK